MRPRGSRIATAHRMVKKLNPTVEILGNAAFQLRKTELKQILWETGSERERRKCLIVLVGRTGIEPVAR